jgi:hypothetical protein
VASPLSASHDAVHHAPMQTTKNGWRIIDGDAGVLTYSYGFGGEGQANCFTAKLPGGGLMVISPPSRVSTEVMQDLAAYGEVVALVANNGYHHLGLAAWRKQFPKARCFAADGAAARIAKKSKDAGELEPLSALHGLLGSDVGVVEAPSSKVGETWAWAKIAGGHAWYASDVLINLERLPKSFIVRTLFKLSKSAPGYRVFNLAVRFIMKDRRASLGAMLEDVRKHPPTVMVPAHGSIVTQGSVATETEQLLGAAI